MIELTDDAYNRLISRIGKLEDQVDRLNHVEHELRVERVITMEL